jgi:ATP-binding cassette subfamily G (WHITE) protein 2 (PDR)
MKFSESATETGSDNGVADSHGRSTFEQQHKHPSSSGSMTLSENNEQESSSGSISPESGDHANTSLTPEDAAREKAITGLAKVMSNSSTTRSNPFEAAPDSVLDPHSPNFRAKDWVKSMIKFSRGNGDDALGRKGGVSFSGLSAYGANAEIDFQKDVSNIWWDILSLAKLAVGLGRRSKLTILHGLEGVVESGEMLVVLGPPGSGCSTFLKTITGQTHGLEVEAHLNYNGLSSIEMNSYYRGEAIYTAEVDAHFPQLSVGDTLLFAAATRAPRIIPGGYKRAQWAKHLCDVAMATFGISHTVNTIVGNDFVRGVSGGERKRVTIAEAALSGAPIQAWDNSTRGLDAANAIEFCKTIRLSVKYGGAAALMSLYQAPQQAYEQFDKVLVLYQGRQVFFGPTSDAQAYFERLGFQCPERQTTADFLTSITSPKERSLRPGFERKSPRTPDDFADAWRRSHERELLVAQIQVYNNAFQPSGEAQQAFVASRRAQQSKGLRKKSPYTLNFLEQIQICLWRGLKRLKGDPAFTYTQLFGNFALALILGSVFYNTPKTAESFFQRGAALFFAILMNAFGSALEILTLYQQRPIVEKQNRYAMYHPSAEALASMLTDMPYKIINAIVFNATLYFLANLRREPGSFFIFLFVNFTLTLTMSMLFRTVGSLTRSLSQALAPAANIMLGLIIFTGFALPEPYMLGWSRWIKYIDPIGT